MSFEHVTSVLVADVGSVHTRLLLIDLVEGQYRLVAATRARTTADPPLGRATLGLEDAAQRMTDLIGRRLVAAEPDQLFVMPEQNGHGADEFLATASAGRPMRVLLVGLTRELSVASGLRALAGSYVTITDVLTPDDLRDEEAQINAIVQGEPDLIVIVGGTDNGAELLVLDLAARVRDGLTLLIGRRLPAVLFAGNQRLRTRITEIFAPLTNVYMAKNVRPSLGEEQLFPAQIELALVYDDYRSKSAGGFAEVGRQSQVGVVPTPQGYISTVRYFNTLPRRRDAVGPLIVDVGSANSVIVAGLRGESSYSIRTDLGVGHHFVGALEAVTPQRVTEWLPFDISPDALWDYAYNKALRPGTIPTTPEELQIEQGLARAIVRALVADSRAGWGVETDAGLPPFDPIIGAGAILTEAQTPGASAMLLLDALQPEGVTELQIDRSNLLSAAGVIAYLKPVITVQVLETGGLLPLGTAFCASGQARYGRAAMQVQIQPESGPTINHTVRSGELWLAPVPPGVAARVTVRMRNGLTMGGKRRIRQRVIAGAAGIIFDARGRPLPVPRPRDRVARLKQWLAAVGTPDAPPVVAPAADPSAIDAPQPEESAHAVLS